MKRETGISVLAGLLLIGAGACGSAGDIDGKVQEALEGAGDNRMHLEAVLNHFQSVGDPEQLQAAKWIIANMPGKAGADSAGGARRVRLFREFESLKHKDADAADSIARILHYRPADAVMTPDLTAMDSVTLISDIEAAFFARSRWPWAATTDPETFIRYVAPYRAGDEPLCRSWRKNIQNRFLTDFDSIARIPGMDDPVKAANAILALPRLKHFEWSGDLPAGPRTGPAMADIFVGDCQDYVDHLIFILRAAGIPCTTDKVPLRGNGNAPHFWAAIPVNDSVTYIEANEKFIPAGKLDVEFLKINREAFDCPTALDVTEYYDNNNTVDLRIPLDELPDIPEGEILLCASSYTDWIPIVKGKVENGEVRFGTVGTGRIVTVAVRKEGNVPQQVAEPLLIDRKGSISRVIASEDRMRKTVLFRKYTPKIAEFADRMVGAVIETSDSPDFRGKTDTLYEITEEPFRLFTTVRAADRPARRFVRYRGKDGTYCNIAELSFRGENNTSAITGLPVGTPGAWGNDTLRAYRNVFDGDPYTSFDFRSPSGGWAGLDLGKPRKISHITYTPRNRDNFIRQGDEYELLYWHFNKAARKGAWKSAGRKRADSDSIIFSAPAGALLYLKNHSRGKDERIFLIDPETGKQIFY